MIGCSIERPRKFDCKTRPIVLEISDVKQNIQTKCFIVCKTAALTKLNLPLISALVVVLDERSDNRRLLARSDD